MKRIAVIPAIRRESEIEYISTTISVLKENGAKVFMEKENSVYSFASEVTLGSASEVFSSCELIVVLGGDGSILRAAEYALEYDIPLIGINLGRLGYMADLEKNEITQLSRVFEGKYRIEERMLVSVEILDKYGNLIPLRRALNDVVINRGQHSSSIDMDLFADSRKVRTIRADGIIISTPTGSTAYSMAAGGSVLDPTLACICATPICPISRYACPLIFSGNSVVEVLHEDDRADSWCITIDGTGERPLYCGEKLIVKRSSKTVKMLSVKNEGFFEILNGKISKYELKN